MHAQPFYEILHSSLFEHTLALLINEHGLNVVCLKLNGSYIVEIGEASKKSLNRDGLNMKPTFDTL